MHWQPRNSPLRPVFAVTALLVSFLATHRRSLVQLSLLWGCSVALVMAVFGQMDALALSPSPAGKPVKTERVPGRLVVKYKDEVAAGRSSSLQALRAVLRVKAAKAVFPDAKRSGARHARRSARAVGLAPTDLRNVFILEVPDDVNLEAAAAALAADQQVVYAHPDVMFTAAAAPNDPFYGSARSWGQAEDDLWGLKKAQAEGGWLLSKGRGVVIAVVDSGLDDTHPDIAANVWSNPGEIPGNGLDDDGNGFVDDVRGWDFTTCARFSSAGACVSPKAAGNDPADAFGHGTHVAGVAAAVGDNGLGVVGMAPQATVMPVKALNDSGQGSSTWVASAIRYAADNGADIINGSLACTAACPSVPVIEDAVRYAASLGAVLVVAAGNNSADIALRSPQNMPEPIVVAASGPADQRLSFSNFGTNLSVSASGGGPEAALGTYLPLYSILSLRSVTAVVDPGLVVGGQYLREAGTSMAAPHVAGLAALLLGQRPTLTAADVRQALQASADDIGDAGFDAGTGYGRINAARALALVNQPPVLQPLAPQTVAEGTLLTLAPQAVDADGDPLTYSASGLSAGAAFTAGTFAWTPDYTQAGAYQVTFSVTDGVAGDAKTLDITVTNVNRPPVLAPVGAQTVDAGQPLSVAFSATDPDGDALAFSVAPMPSGASLTDGVLAWTPTEAQAGTHLLTVSVSDGALSDAKTLTVTVRVPAPPAPDNLPPTLRILSPDLNHDGKVNVADLHLVASRFNQRNSLYDVNGDDVVNAGDLALIASMNGLNWPPTNVREGRRVIVFMVGEDPERQPLSFSAQHLPAGAVFRQPYPARPNLRQFIFRPTHRQAGSYQPSFTVSDGTSTATASLPIVVLGERHRSGVERHDDDD